MGARPIAGISEGRPEPLGVTPAGDGVNVAVYSAGAALIEFCLFDETGQTEIVRIPLPAHTGPVFHGHVAGVAAGARYGLRAHGPFAPTQGQRFNPNKLLVDPYALALDRPYALHPSMFGYRPDDPRGGDSFDATDSAAVTPKAIVAEASAPPPAAAPFVPWGETVVYELHVRGFTKSHPDIPEAIRGTFAALAHPAAIGHLKRLGVTTVEILPAAAWIDERHLPPLGLSNYWGYNPVSFMVPDPRLAPGGWAEVRAATDALAAAGIESVLDVVFNHSGEGDQLGPTLSLRGLDNATYYRLATDDMADYIDDTGTGDTLALDRPAGVRLVMDSLRTWRRLGGMTGFRFDLATVLGRRADGFDPMAPLLLAIDQDPELRELKLIAEPWDIGPGGYQCGRFPPAWGEWNDRFRDAMRGFWRGDGATLGELARRMSGSEDLLAGRRPSRSVNFIVAHDGFTLADLVSFERKQNLANGEHGRDGTDDNRSWNNGVEGPTDDPAVLAARAGDQRALLALLMLARGTPMLTMGAELGHSQGGNNNAYAQDNATSWLDWAKADQDLLAFAGRLAAIRRDHPALRADRFLTGEPGAALWPDVAWRRADGGPMTPADWEDANGATLVMALAEPADGGPDRAVVAIHRGAGEIDVVLPEPRDGMAWTLLADSAAPDRSGSVETPSLTLAKRSVAVLAETAAPDRRPRPVDPASLGRLADAAGIAADWWTTDGRRREVSPDTQRALLAAMGLPGETAQQALESLAGLAEAHDRRALPFAVVRRLGQPVEVPVRFASGAAAPRTWLTITGEDGQVQRLRVSPETCDETAVVARDGRASRALRLVLPALTLGRYRLTREDRPDIVCRLTIAPDACFAPRALTEGRRLFGLSAQLYSVARQGDQGIGDFTTLGELGAAAAREGAAVVAINPLHVLFEQERERASPYYPSDRRFLDPIYLDLDKVAGGGKSPVAPRALSGQPVIDYPAVWAQKAAALEASFAGAENHPGLADFIAAAGEALQTFATSQAIAETRPGESWRVWPEALRDPDGPGVRAFAEANATRVRFHQYVQWLCERQLAEAAEAAGGLELGVCRDLAVGAAPDGAEAWAKARLLAQGVSVGAPPDSFSADGQVWGLPPFSPLRLEEDGYAHLAQLFAANMRRAGAIRIDHVLGLVRQFWVPQGAHGSEGAYVAYPAEDLLGELALESERARCLVIGEDLGTVPPGLRETLAADQVLSYRVLPFETDDGRFRPPQAYPRLALACVSTHDLPPLAGWWDGVDIDERLELGLTSPEATEQARAGRLAARSALLDALAEAGLIEAGLDATTVSASDVTVAIHAFVASTPSFLAVAQVEDLAGERSAINLPGTDRQRPNWRRRVATPLEGLMEAPAARAILDAIRAARAAGAGPA
ncbi:MAG: glycogen debranching protein GlgX [Caulobacteraceae bacterium]|nr:glycogen debranching protein GlgX [Caulobacteraceae bacterium]